jgi:hypothetical protein
MSANGFFLVCPHGWRIEIGVDHPDMHLHAPVGWTMTLNAICGIIISALLISYQSHTSSSDGVERVCCGKKTAHRPIESAHMCICTCRSGSSHRASTMHMPMNIHARAHTSVHGQHLQHPVLIRKLTDDITYHPFAHQHSNTALLCTAVPPLFLPMIFAKLMLRSTSLC